MNRSPPFVHKIITFKPKSLSMGGGLGEHYKIRIIDLSCFAGKD